MEGIGIKRIHCTPVVLKFPAPEYKGVARWGIEQWTTEEIEALFAEMERDGIKLIVPTIGAGDRVWYHSRILRPQSEIDWVERLFDLAAAHDMQVALSGIPYTYHLQFQEGNWDPQADLEMNRRICSELCEMCGQRPNFWGWYIPHETGDRTHRGDVMIVLRALPPFLKTLTPDRPVAHSPWFTSHLTIGPEATTPIEFAAEWDAMLHEIDGLDILAIQDSTAPFDEIGDWFKAIASICEYHHIKLWSVVELFPRDHRTGSPDMTRAISFADLKAKMTAAAPHVEGYACWEYQNYLNPHSPVQGAKKTSAAYRAFFEADPGAHISRQVRQI